MPDVNFAVRLVDNDDSPLENYKISVFGVGFLNTMSDEDYTDEDGIANFCFENLMNYSATVDIYLTVSSMTGYKMMTHTFEDGDEVTISYPDDDFVEDDE